MAAEAAAKLNTVRDWLEVTVERFNKAGLYFGHGSDNAYDEAAYLLLHTLKLPLDDLDAVLGRRLTPAEIESLEGIASRRVDERLPAAYLTHEAWLGEFRFYVDERAIVPRSYIAELLRDELAPWVSDDQPVNTAFCPSCNIYIPRTIRAYSISTITTTTSIIGSPNPAAGTAEFCQECIVTSSIGSLVCAGSGYTAGTCCNSCDKYIPGSVRAYSISTITTTTSVIGSPV